jgi:mono/diheme cytochrome c family protein
MSSPSTNRINAVKALLIVAFILLLVAVQERPSPAQTSFSQTLYPVLEKAACSSCHNADGVASATRLIFPEAGASNAQIEAFGLSLAALVDQTNPAESLLLKKPTNRIPHAGGQRIAPGSEEEKALQAWVARLARLTPDDLARAAKAREAEAASAVRPSVALRRLTHSQYNNTIRDLLNDQSAPANQFPPEDFLNGFKTQYQAQTLSPLLVEAYSAAAERLARNAFQGGDRRGLIPCKPSAACRTRFIREFGLKAFRRPLEADEQKRYEALFSETDFYKGAQLVVEAILQSPTFLFRLEETTNPKWKPYVTASRLSYALWDTMPDAALLESAARNELSTPQAVETTARRMLTDPRAQQALNEFVSQWLRFDRLLTAGKDRRRYPSFNRETAFAMTEEARTFVSDLVWNDRDFTNIFTADYSFANADIAAIYGVPAPAKEFDRIRFPAESERAGLLGQTLFLALTAKPDDTSPTARGLYVREQFLCQHVAEPPPGVNTNLPDITEAKPQTNRDRMREHVTNPSCATCHNLIDPIGFGFEKFDAIGARRETFKLRFFGSYEGGHNTSQPKSVELPLDTAGYVAGLPDSRFANPRELGAVLARSPSCQECLVKQYFRYTAGRMETPADRAMIRQVTEDFIKSQFRFKELMISFVRAREF